MQQPRAIGPALTATATGLIGKAVLVLCAAAAAWQILSFTIQDIQPGPPSGPNSRARALLAEAESVQGSDPQRAASLASQALAASPLESGALALLAGMAAGGEDRAKSDALTELAAQRSFYDAESQGRLIGVLLQRGDYNAAIDRADGLMNARPQYREQLFAMIGSLTRDPRSRAAVVERLAEAPDWRSGFLRTFSEKAEDVDLMRDLLAELAASANPPTRNEVRLYLSRLISAQRFDDAYGFWLTLVSPADGSGIPPLYDGGFSQEPDGLPFGWSISKARNVEIGYARRDDAGDNRALRIDFAGGQVDFRNVSQITRLDPGSYSLEGTSKAERLRTEKGLIWRVSCLSTKKSIGETAPVSGSTGWSSFSAAFVVPPDGCAAQEVRLVLDAHAKRDQEISGRVWYDDMKIVPTPTNPAAR